MLSPKNTAKLWPGSSIKNSPSAAGALFIHPNLDRRYPAITQAIRPGVGETVGANIVRVRRIAEAAVGVQR